MGRIGAFFCAVIGVFMAATSPGLGLSDHDLVVCEAVAAALVLSSTVLWFLPWAGLPRRALILCPAVVVIGVGVLGEVTVSAAQSFLGALTLCVVYLGMTGWPGATVAALPFLVADWYLAYPSHPATVLVRLPLAVVVWVLVGEILARAARELTEEASVLRSSALTDPLTQLPNRRKLTQELSALPVGGLVMFLDLDYFKAFNDRYGHPAGDAVLLQFAGIVKGALRSDDIVARYGGEEFVIVLPVTTSSTDVYERLRDAWSVAGGPITFSAGVAQRVSGEAPEATMRRADEALYRAKASGRDQLVFDVACVPWTEASLEESPAFAEEPNDIGFTVQHVLNRLKNAGARTTREGDVTARSDDRT